MLWFWNWYRQGCDPVLYSCDLKNLLRQSVDCSFISILDFLKRHKHTWTMETKEDLRKRLTPIQYQVTQEAGTERPFTGKYNKFYDSGVYECIVCHQELFSSDTKYDSGCGWPAFNDVLDQKKVTLHRDASIAGTEETCFLNFSFFVFIRYFGFFIQKLCVDVHLLSIFFCWCICWCAWIVWKRCI